MLLLRVSNLHGFWGLPAVVESLVADRAVALVAAAGGGGGDGLTDGLDEGTATVVDVESRRDGEEVSWLVPRGENVVRVLLTASRIQKKTGAVVIEEMVKSTDMT